MLVAVLSDTHVARAEVEPLLERLAPQLAGVDAIIHAGDVGAVELLDELERLAPVHAVAGNMDGGQVLARLPERRILELEGHRIGLMHGWGAPGDLPQRVRASFLGTDWAPEVELAIFGHSHQPLFTRLEGVLLLNPGSPTDRRWAPYRSLAHLEIGAELCGRIIRLP